MHLNEKWSQSPLIRNVSHNVSECACKNGTCNNGPNGDGSCVQCHPGFTGQLCNEGKQSSVFTIQQILFKMLIRLLPRFKGK